MEVNAVFLGKSSGKSSLLVRKCSGEFSWVFDPTIEDSYKVSVEVDGRVTHFNITDTSGQEEFYPIVRTYIRTSKVIVFVFCIFNRWTFDELPPLVWITHEDFEEDSKVRILVGTGIDREEERAVTREEAEAYARAHGMRYIETSARTNQNVDELFELMAREYNNKLASTPPPVQRKKKESNSGEGLCTIF